MHVEEFQTNYPTQAGFPLAIFVARSEYFPLSLSFRLEPSGTNCIKTKEKNRFAREKSLLKTGFTDRLHVWNNYKHRSHFIRDDGRYVLERGGGMFVCQTFCSLPPPSRKNKILKTYFWPVNATAVQGCFPLSHCHSSPV